MIWSEKVASPNHKWLVIAETKQHGGLGTAGILTDVYLERQKAGTSQPILILEFLHDENSTKPINLRMGWLDASHLVLSYATNPRVEFQAVTCAGIEILLVHRSA